jgi:hypothetical protein
MKALYEVPEIHEVGAADVVVRGSKEVGTGDSGVAPLQHDAMAAYDVPEIHEVGAASEVVKGTKPVGDIDSDANPFRYEQTATNE